MICNGDQLDDICRYPYRPKRTCIEQRASLTNPSNMAPIGWSCCVKSLLGMLEESILGWWDGVQRLEATSKHSFPGSLTNWVAQFLLYLSTVKGSSRLILGESSFRLAGSWVMVVNAVVASGKFTHVFHAVFLPISIMDTTSLHVKAWKKGKAWQRCSSQHFWVSALPEKCRAPRVLGRGRRGLPTLQHHYLLSRGMPSYDPNQQHGASGASSLCRLPLVDMETNLISL